MSAKIKALSEIEQIASSLKLHGKKLVTTNGCFDILHIGHVRYLEEAKAQGDVLIVGLNTDQSVRSNKGPRRPVVPQEERAEMLAALSCVDYVFLFSDETPVGWLEKIKPNVHVKGGDYTLDKIIESEVVEKNGGKIYLASVVHEKSTTNIINKIISRYY